MKYLLSTLLFFLAFFSSNAQTQKEKEEKIRSVINLDFHQNASKCSFNVNAVTDINNKKEFWSICQLKNGNRILKIQSYEKEIYFEEIYFEKKGSLMYVKETENYVPKNHFNQMSWNCEYYTKNGELLTLISLGHGKTEDENWNPDYIFDRYKRRLSELKKIKE
ncbi:hypothetical protein FIA58_002830 [Flavobacterium jejuense]|uniref:Uncharacterized protein n=1 Tax=Flavobacterium jejuense TaxID=1544455 RepID=A0ABX0IRY7_9FLAO|nr:hypothetical protein [Flavobacterium jejuense]NHN24600.1 hypothetical protein [Flavobacterium jejuense]